MIFAYYKLLPLYEGCFGKDEITYYTHNIIV